MERTEDRVKDLWNNLEKNQQKKSEIVEYNASNASTTKKQDELIAFLESEVTRLRNDRNEECQYNQQLWEEINEQGEHQEVHENRDVFEEVSEIGHKDHEDSKPRISRREADKIVVPPWPKSHDLHGWKRVNCYRTS